MNRIARRVLFACLLAVALFGLYRITGNRPMAAQAQFSGVPQPRPINATPVVAGQVVLGQNCAYPRRCVAPTTGTGRVAGVAVDAASNPGDMVNVVMHGEVTCVFDNTPIQGNLVTNSNGSCHDSGVQAIASIRNLVGVVGSCTMVVDSTHCVVTTFAPLTVGGLIDISTIDPAQLTAYIQANQLTSAGPPGPQGIQGIQGNPGVAGSPGATGPAGTTSFLNGTSQSGVSCNTVTGTSSGAGAATVANGVSMTTLMGIPDCRVTNSAVASCTVAAGYTASSATINTTAGTVVSIVGINIVSLGGAALPYSVTFCGK